MKPPTQVPTLRDYLHILKHGWIVIVLTTALSVGAGWLVRETSTPVYQATTRLFVLTPGGAEVQDAYYGNLTAMVGALNYPQLARSSQVTMRTIDELGLHQTPQDLAGHIKAGVLNALVLIQVTGADPNLTRDTANGVTNNLIELSHEMAGIDTAGNDVVLVDAARTVSDGRGPLARYLILGGVLGLALSVVLVIAVGLARDAVLAREQVAQIVDDTVGGMKK